MDKCFDVIRDIVIAIAALLTAYTAYRGLETWKKGLYVTLGREILASLYRIRRIVEGIRLIDSPYMREKFALLPDEMDKLRAMADEAEVLWNVQIKMKVKTLDDLISTLVAALTTPENLLSVDDRVMNVKIKSGPKFGSEINEALNSITEIVRLHFRAK